MTQYWFKRKRYGLGAVPSSWQGWALVAAYVATLGGLAAALGVSDNSQPPMAFIAIGGVITFVFLVICWRTTDGGWGWRWGGD